MDRWGHWHRHITTDLVQTTRRVTMPYVNVRILKGRSREQKAQLVDVITTALADICNAPVAGTHVVIDEVDRENCAVAGQLVADRDG